MWFDLIGIFSGIISGIITALFSVWLINHYRDFKEKQKVFQVLLTELEENKERSEINLKFSKKGEITKLQTPYLTLSRKMTIVRGVYLDLPYDLRKDLQDIYIYIDKLHRVITHPDGVFDNPREAYDGIELMIELNKKCMDNLEVFMEENGLNVGYFKYIKKSIKD